MVYKPTSQNTTDFSPHLLSILRAPPSPLPRLILGILLTLLGLVVLWAFWGKLDIVARAEGKLIPQTRLKVVQPLEGGRVSKILVREGELVDAGQPLILMDSAISQADTRKLELELKLTELQVRRIEAELDERPFQSVDEDDALLFQQVHEQFLINRAALTADLNEQKSALIRIQEQLASASQVKEKLEELLPIYRANEEAYEKLAKVGNSGRLELMDKRKDRIEAEQDLRAQRHNIKALQAEMAQAEFRVDRITTMYRQRLLQERGVNNQKIAQLKEDLGKQLYRNHLLELTAPQNGIVQNVAVSTEGSVVPSGTVLLTLVPDNEPLQAEVFIENKDIGFIDSGQNAKIKLSTYSFQRYGMIDATVENISADSISDQNSSDTSTSRQFGYKAILTLEQQQLVKQGIHFDLRPGMQVSAEIKTGSRSVVEYLLSPVRKTLSEAAHER
ncbi:HlyD family type I secretion periplasmic adaptor subunit [Marinimicrobium sp. LS-A18]|uniref:HlyD family type I secretion periplasmic adaptor subunit n=1 Tax=Marinimicrobium sp. LS-A18 TaxID=1381596 RepID=UPI000465B5A0|nr:HlyD family type I secretion periplasmic adaptor subunit [Marinimicrobium sp. LS-A18]